MTERNLVRIQPNTHALSPCAFVPLENLIEGDPQEIADVLFEGRGGSTQIGLWQAEPYVEKVTPYGVDEFCHVLSGVITFEDNQGETETFREGECFLVRKSFSGIFRVEETAKKLFVIFES